MLRGGIYQGCKIVGVIIKSRGFTVESCFPPGKTIDLSTSTLLLGIWERIFVNLSLC